MLMKLVVRSVNLTAVILAALTLTCASTGYARINVVCTTTDLADLARQIGGSKVEVTSLMLGTQNPHVIEPRPSQVLKLSRADVLVRIGMDLDLWADSLIDAARNSRIRRGSAGYADASVGIRKLEVPTGRVDPSMGDIHIYGNPHYWLDPENAKIAAKNILAALKRASPGDSAYFERNYDSFADRIDRKMQQWKQALAPYRGQKVITYHKSWIYFLRRFGLVELATVEPKPGIPPSPSHVREVISKAKPAGVKVIMMEPFYPRRFPDLIAKETGAKVVMVPASVGGLSGVDNYFDLIDTIVQRLAEAFK